MHIRTSVTYSNVLNLVTMAVINLLSIRFSGSERRSSVKTFGETLEERLELPAPKRRPSAIFRGKVGPRV